MRRGLLRSCALGALGLPVIAAVVTPLASIAMAGTLMVNRMVGLLTIGMPRITYCWWIYAWRHGLDPHYTTKLAVTGGIPFGVGVVMLTVALVRRRPRRLRPARPGQEPIEPDRAPSNLHGKARWMTMDEAAALFPGPHPAWGGIPVGEAYRPDLDEAAKRPFDENDHLTWGHGGKAPLLQTPLNAGAISGIIIGGSGSYKTMAFTVPAMTTWLGSAVVLDPSQQVGTMVQRLREDEMGHQVVLVDPANPHLGSFNPLMCIDIDDPMATVHLVEFVDWCASVQSGEKSEDEDKFFVESAKELEVCLLADMLWDTDLPAEQRTSMPEWRRRLVIPEQEMPKYLRGVFANSKSSYARDLAGTLMRTTPKTFSGIYKHATSDTKWLSIPAYAKLLSGNTFDPRMLTHGKLTVIVQISDGDIKATPAVGRIVIGSLGRVMLRAQGRTATPVPFILDEMDNLKFMPILEVLRDMGRKSGVALFPMWQSTGQIEKTWGKEGKRSWYASSAWRLYAMTNDEETASEVSKRCGSYTVLNRTEGISTSRQNPFSGGSWSRGVNDNVSEHSMPLISEYDVQTALRGDEAILIPRGKPALRIGRPLYWRRVEMVDKVDRDPFRREAVVEAAE